MYPEQLRGCLASTDTARPVLYGWGLRDLDRGQRNLTALAGHLGVEALAHLTTPLTRLLPRCADADMALNNLERFFAHPAGPALVSSLLDNRARTLEILLGLFSTSQLFSDLLAQHPDDAPSLLLLSRAVNAMVDEPPTFSPVWDLPGK